MRRFCAALGFAVAMMLGTGCGPRAASVRTAPTTAETTLHFTNNLSQAVNVYVVQNGSETFVRQVGANTTENLPIRGFAAGTQVQLRAVSVDGKSQFDSRDPIVLSSSAAWKVP